jgi:hypothetical protein
VFKFFGPRDSIRWTARYAGGSQVASLQHANAALGTVTREPQTTATPQSGDQVPFVRRSRKATLPLFDVLNQSFGNPPQLPTIKPVAGWHRRWRMEVIATGGSGTGVAYGTSDGPYNIINNLQVRDPFNQPIFNVSGYGLYLIGAYGCQFAEANFGNDISKAPSATITLVTTTGNFVVPFYIPFELDSAGYCAIPGLSAAAVPQIAITTNGAGTVYQTAPGTTTPVLEYRMYSDFWAAPVDDPAYAPPSAGSSAQWSEGKSPLSWATNTNSRLALPRVGTFIHTLIMILRDANGNRQDAFPQTDLTFWVDSVPIETEDFNSRIDKMFQWSGVTRPAGVIAYTFRDSEAVVVQASDTHDRDLYTTPSTLLEIGGTSGSAGVGPYQLTVETGELYAEGGIPYTHLAQ